MEYPLLRHEIARYRQADMLREAARERLGRELRLAAQDTTRRRFRFRLRRREQPAYKPALEP